MRTVLRKRRLEREISQLALAETVGVSGPYIHIIETRKQTPSDDCLKRIARALKWPVRRREELLKGIRGRTPNGFGK